MSFKILFGTFFIHIYINFSRRTDQFLANLNVAICRRINPLFAAKINVLSEYGMVLDVGQLLALYISLVVLFSFSYFL